MSDPFLVRGDYIRSDIDEPETVIGKLKQTN